MTVKEAMKTVEGYLPDCDTRKFVLDILSRAEPKKPYDVDVDRQTCDCPNCLSRLWSSDDLSLTGFCCVCGQALDWEELEKGENE